MTDATAIRFWDQLARRYAKQPIRDPEAYEYTLGRIRSYLHGQDSVLEVGCGTGSTALLLADQVGAYRATDVSSEMIAIAQEKPDAPAGLTFAATDVLTEPDGTYDAVLALNLLHLIPDVDAALDRLAALVKPGGVLISKTVVSSADRIPLKMRMILLMLPLMQWLGKAPFVRFMTPEQLDEALTSRGFEIIETAHAPAGPPPVRFIVARKVG